LQETSDILTSLWYFACTSKALRKGALVRRILFDNPVVLGRTNNGDAFALRDICPHRGAPLSEGRVTNDANGCVECPYHGWRFRANDGGCENIPSLSASDTFDGASIAVQHFPLHEANGMVWVFHGDGTPPATPEIELPRSFKPKSVTVVTTQGPYDEAVIGLVDPAHTPLVHKQWWWREGKKRQEKTKQFEPTALGFRMPPHRPSSNSRIYSFLGGTPTTEIEFRLPGLRLETVRNNKHTIFGLTAITPGEANESVITHMLFWDMALLTALTPIINDMAESFLNQDGAILDAQNLNLSRQPHRPLYAGEPDVPAQWYSKLKRAWIEKGHSEYFENPLTKATLQWRT